MHYYLVQTAQGATLMWCGSTPERAAQNAQDATGLQIVAVTELPPVAVLAA